MSVQPAPNSPTPSSERARLALERARAEKLVSRERRRFARQMQAQAALLMRSARISGGGDRLDRWADAHPTARQTTVASSLRSSRHASSTAR